MTLLKRILIPQNISQLLLHFKLFLILIVLWFNARILSLPLLLLLQPTKHIRTITHTLAHDHHTGKISGRGTQTPPLPSMLGTHDHGPVISLHILELKHSLIVDDKTPSQSTAYVETGVAAGAALPVLVRA